MYRRNRRKKMAEINVVPYIDVMLVLLIIFMVTAPLITQGVKVDLPQGNAKPLPDEALTPLVASIDGEGRLYLSVGDSKNEPLEPEQLTTLVAAHLQVEPKTPVMVKGDKSVPYDYVIQLMVLLQKAGASSVGLMMDPEEQ